MERKKVESLTEFKIKPWLWSCPILDLGGGGWFVFSAFSSCSRHRLRRSVIFILTRKGEDIREEKYY